LGDVLGYPNPKELLHARKSRPNDKWSLTFGEGRVSYIASDVTIWDKEFVLIDEIEKLLKGRDDDLEKLIAISHVRRAAEEGVTRVKLEEMKDEIERDIGRFRELLDGPSAMPKHMCPETDAAVA
jgi:hypothetical protein